MADPDDLLLMFQSMGTTDHETLINQLRTIVSDIDPDAARFFLEANNWNLQNAVTSYFDAAGDGSISRQQQSAAEAEAVARSLRDTISLSQTERVLRETSDYEAYTDSTLPEMTIVSELSDSAQVAYAGKPFVRQWRIRNSGSIPWPPNCQLVYVSGERMERAAADDFVPPLSPGEECTITIVLVAPPRPGEYVATWRAAIVDETSSGRSRRSHRAGRASGVQFAQQLRQLEQLRLDSEGGGAGMGGMIDFGRQGYPMAGGGDVDSSMMDEQAGEELSDAEQAAAAASEVSLRFFGEAMWLIVSVGSDAEQAMVDELDFNALRFGGSQGM